MVVAQIDNKIKFEKQPSWDDLIKPQMDKLAAQRAAEEAAERARQLTQIIPTVHQGDVEAWRGLVAQYFPAYQVEYALAVMRCESGGDPQAVGDGGTPWPSYGLFQIRALPGRPSPDWLVVPANNVAYAYQLWASQGWYPWSCARRI